METNIQTKIYKLSDRMDKYHSSPYSSSKYTTYTHSNNENKSKTRSSPRENESTTTTYKHYLNSHDFPQRSQSHRETRETTPYHASTSNSNNIYNEEDNSQALIANATVFSKSRIQTISTKEYLNIKSYFEQHILNIPKLVAENRSSLLISDITSFEGHSSCFVLPRLKIDEFIDNKQVSENIASLSMKWPLEKSGYILRKNIYTSESNNNMNNSNPSVINKIKHTTFLKKEKIQETSVSASSSKWLIFYVEIRGPYIFFYQLIRKKTPPKPSSNLKTKHSVMNKMSIENIRKNLVDKPLSRILSISKSNTNRRQVKIIETTSSSSTNSQIIIEEDSEIQTNSPNQHQHYHHNNSLICTVNDINGPLEILSAKKVLVHYIPLYYSVVTPIITDNNPNILALSTIQGVDLKEEEPKYLMDQMLIEISNIGVSHVIEENSIDDIRSFDLDELMHTEVLNWKNSLKQGSYIKLDTVSDTSVSDYKRNYNNKNDYKSNDYKDDYENAYISDYKNDYRNIMEHLESNNNSPITEKPNEDLFQGLDLKNYTFPEVPKTDKDSKDMGEDKIKSIQNQYTQKKHKKTNKIDNTKTQNKDEWQ